MTQFEDNNSPYLTLVEQGSAPSSPAATKRKLYVLSSDHLAYLKDSSGVVVNLISNPMTTKGDIIVGDTSGVPIRKAVGSDGQVLTADAASTGGIKWAAAGGGSAVANVDRKLYTGGDKTTTSTTFTDLDATNASITMTTGAHRVRVTFNATITSNGANAVAFDIDIDGTLQSGGATFGLAATNIKGNSVADIVCIDYVSAALTAASHTIKMKWRTAAGTATCYASGSVSPLHFAVEELQA